MRSQTITRMTLPGNISPLDPILLQASNSRRLCTFYYADWNVARHKLDSWYRVPSAWPNRRDLDAFDRWFEWSFHSRVVDLSNNPLLQEEI